MSRGFELADLVAEYLSDVERGFTMTVNVAVPDGVPEGLNLEGNDSHIHQGIAVWVAPQGEELKAHDHVAWRSEWTLNLFVSRYLYDGISNREMSGLSEEIRGSLRGQDFGSYTLSEITPVSIYDSDLLASQDRFLSAVQIKLWNVC